MVLILLMGHKNQKIPTFVSIPYRYGTDTNKANSGITDKLNEE